MRIASRVPPWPVRGLTRGRRGRGTGRRQVLAAAAAGQFSTVPWENSPSLDANPCQTQTLRPLPSMQAAPSGLALQHAAQAFQAPTDAPPQDFGQRHVPARPRPARILLVDGLEGIPAPAVLPQD